MLPSAHVGEVRLSHSTGRRVSIRSAFAEFHCNQAAATPRHSPHFRPLISAETRISAREMCDAKKPPYNCHRTSSIRAFFT
ncbi:hypothetical protein KDX23_21865 [Burkholderia vietnamiensis]|uniref:hypothetical protein n=1 Tax=Burkholderia vietnamiensis TaxID=60552 RepID=UPI001B9986B1|nr:hypothetical protein [Burkholderia vietnamiensis]MBR8085388.1 hypothetical protein [Burkholderia vietnamiensis]